jgi:hypothetical protein
MGKLLRCRVRYFTDRAVIGSRGFVDEVFRMCRERFSGTAAAGTLWRVRDLQKGIG